MVATPVFPPSHVGVPLRGPAARRAAPRRYRAALKFEREPNFTLNRPNSTKYRPKRADPKPY